MADDFTQDTSKASADLRELTALARLFDVDLVGAVDEITNAGCSIWVREIDDVAAEITGCRVVSYKLHDRLEAILATLRTRQRVAQCVGVGHSVPLSEKA